MRLQKACDQAEGRKPLCHDYYKREKDKAIRNIHNKQQTAVAALNNPEVAVLLSRGSATRPAPQSRQLVDPVPRGSGRGRSVHRRDAR